MDGQLAHDALTMRLSRADADIEVIGDFFVTEYLAGNASFRKRRETLRAAVERRAADFSRSQIQTVKILRR